jgi:septum formation protein
MTTHNLLPNLQPYTILLASQSPRRQQLLSEMGLVYTSKVKENVDESYPVEMPADEVPEFLALKKADAYFDDLLDMKTIVITADTIVTIDNEVLGKPGNRDDAFAMLRKLSGREHQVITGVAIRSLFKVVCFSETTRVWFKALTDEEIEHYVDQYEPFDKAGAYGIQEWIGLIGIDKIEGSYHNVVGLPVQRLYKELRGF